MSVAVQRFQEIFQEGPSFVDLMPYIKFQDGVFVNMDGSLGKIWRLSPWESEGLDSDHLSALSSQAHNFLSRLPCEQIACQFILFSDCQVQERLDKYAQAQKGEAKDDLFSQGRLAHVHNAAQGFWPQSPDPFTPRRIQVLVTLRYFPKWKAPGFVDKTREIFNNKMNIHLDLEHQMQEHMQEFFKYVHLMEGVMTSAQTSYEGMDDQGLADFLYPVLNPLRSIHNPGVELDDRETIRDQLLFNAPKVTGKGLICEEAHYQVVTLKELPDETKPGMFCREWNETTRYCLLDACAQLMCVINLTVPSPEKSRGRLNLHKSFAFLHQNNWLGDRSVEVVEQKNELDGLIGEIFKGGQRIVHARIHFIVRDSSEKGCEESADRLINLLSRFNAEGFKEEIIGASLFLASLPLNFDPYYERFIKRVKLLASANAADMLPLWGSMTGTKTPAQMYFNRRGEIVFLDFFDSNINPHALVIGASGAGKSFFMNDFIVQNQRLGAHFFVLDKGDSYQKLCAILGGQYMAFDLNHPVTINPFVHELTPENQSFLMSLLSQMACGGDERDRLNREEEGLLQKAVGCLYERIKEREITLSDLTVLLNDNTFNNEFGINSVMGPTLALRLAPFTRKGPYGRFFDGENQFQVKGVFTVFELANLSAYGDLQLAVLLNLMFFITNFVSQPQMRPLRKYLLIDEAWSLLKVKNTADFITNAFKTFRKYRCSAVAITQEMADLTRQESGIAILANASNKIFLKQEAALIDLLKSGLSMSEAMVRALKTVETVKGRFAEALVITDSSRGIVRLIPDPLLYWAANSEARNNTYLWNKVEQEGGDIKNAIAVCAKEYPYGLP